MVKGLHQTSLIMHQSLANDQSMWCVNVRMEKAKLM